MTEHHDHDTVWVMSADEAQARLYCRDCGDRGAWGDLPPELQPPSTTEPAEES